MRYVISCFLLTLLTFGLVLDDAEAGRFGGGRSFGIQRSHSSLFTPRGATSSAFSKQGKNKGRLGSAIGGLLVGGLLASLFMGHGLGAGLLSWLMMGTLAFLVLSFFKRRMQPAFQTSQNNAFRSNGAKPSSYSFNSNSSAGFNGGTTDYPVGFNPESFTRSAKVTFIRLQTAFDQTNLLDLADFTAPDVYAEIKMQLDERGNQPNKTEINQLEAELLNVSKQANGTIASVRFTGSIKENNDPSTKLDEIWHFRQFASNTNWVVAGIQQEVVEPIH